ncbi:MAG: laccase domain-containing protein, partial [bacterium]
MIRSELLQSALISAHGFGKRGVPVESYIGGLGIEACRHFQTNQIHGNRVHRLPVRGGGDALQGDAFMTDEPGVVCSVRTADCVPIIIADIRRGAVAAVHAGWRGTACDVAGATIGEMSRAFETEPADCVAAIGPRICGRCYEVGEEVVNGIEALGIGGEWRRGGSRVDLGAANFELLARAG